MSWHQSPMSKIEVDSDRSECMTSQTIASCILLRRPVISRQREAVTKYHQSRREKCKWTDTTWPFRDRWVLWRKHQSQKPQMTTNQSSDSVCWEYWPMSTRHQCRTYRSLSQVDMRRLWWVCQSQVRLRSWECWEWIVSTWSWPSTQCLIEWCHDRN